jgi:hypothetical protein
MGLDSSVGVATPYGLGGSVLDSRRGGGFFALGQTSPGAHPAYSTRGTKFLPREIKRPGRGFNHPPHLTPRLKKE